jgi:hypothetical protein
MQRTTAHATGTLLPVGSFWSGVAAVLAKKSPAARAALMTSRNKIAVRFLMADTEAQKRGSAEAQKPEEKS